MDEVGIAGNRVDFAADGLEFLIEIGQILQFCGAHEGKIGRIEEEHAPLAQDVRLGDSPESVVLVALYGEIGNFFLNQGHGWFNLHSYFLRLAITNYIKNYKGYSIFLSRGSTGGSEYVSLDSIKPLLYKSAGLIFALNRCILLIG